ncbi:acyltransferase family protein [Raoultella ornithinolytica]|uniref:acyltransferase family protein n=1 Tax=Raoultella ornithinolytica TaxID=54291 RepID=UPI00292BCD08|nr:acyltransferase family protein [Raoultella ornithinolytica]MDV0603710.1 acyltransferase family protein [Raoultella ornithinolytica]
MKVTVPVNPSAKPQPPIQPKAFRHDINGLRAWAVFAVVLYHFGVPGFSGGFVGVDVFFVISGFLMTGIIISGLERGNFSLWGFYLARARRIIPALLVLCASLLILGWFWLPNAYYRMLAVHVGTAVAFISNFKFWREAGYFDAASHEKWLLHTWSLSVEWQFYILLPLGCLLLWHWFGKRGVKLALIAAGVLSLVLSVYASSLLGAFYLLPTRAWEMLAGGLAWWATRQHSMSRQWARLAEGVGFALIIWAIATFDPAMLWPSYLALVPVVGAMLVLAANRQRSWLTANPFARQLGASSYSIYLWHWPLVVLLTYAGEQANPQWMVLAILGSWALGELSLRYVENPSRKGLNHRGLWAQSGLLVGLAAALVFVGIKFAHLSPKGRIDPAIEFVANESQNRNPLSENCSRSEKNSDFKSPLCRFGSGEPNAIVMGDSHAQALVTSVAVAAESSNGSAIELNYSRCPTVLGAKNAKNSSNQCHLFNEYYVNELNRGLFRGIPLIVINRNSYSIHGFNENKSDVPDIYFSKKYQHSSVELDLEYHKHFVDTMCQLSANRDVYLVRPIPEMGVNVPYSMVGALMFGKPDPTISISLEEYHARHKVVWAAQDAAAAQCGVKILDPLPYLCHDGRCWGSKDGRPIYIDDDHLSEFGNKLLVPMFKQVFAASASQ